MSKDNNQSLSYQMATILSYLFVRTLVILFFYSAKENVRCKNSSATAVDFHFSQLSLSVATG